MQIIEVEGKSIPMNARGMLENYGDWSEEVARSLAREDGLELNECHWAAINFMREYYNEFEVPPSPRIMVQKVGDKMSTTGKCTGKTLQRLFPQGGCKHACRIAGLPREYCNAC